MSFEPVDWPNEPTPDDNGDFYGQIPGQVPGQLAFDLGPDFNPAQEHQLAPVTDAHHAQLAEQRAHNSKLYGELMAHGRIPEPAKIVMTRLNILIDRLLGDITDLPRMLFELEFEAAITELLTTLIEQTRQSKLVMPDSASFGNIAAPFPPHPQR